MEREIIWRYHLSKPLLAHPQGDGMTTGLFFGSTNGEVESVAENIKAALGASISIYENIGNTSIQQLEYCDNLILGISTWDIGQLQADWDVFWPKLDQTKF